MRKPYGGVFETLDFPPYKFQEYPKAVQLQDGSTTIVNTKAEELAIIDQLLATETAVVQADVINEQAKALVDKDRELAEMRKKLEELTKAKDKDSKPPAPVLNLK